MRDLHVFQAAAETGSMAKAAAHLSITQPAVSYAISELEHAVGVPLLERSSQGVAPTVYGQALLARSAIVFNELRQGLNEIASLADPEVGELRLGTTPPMSAVASAVLTGVMRTAFEEQGLEFPRATVITSSTYALSVLIGSGNFLGIHPHVMLTTPNKHPLLTAVDVRLPTTRGAIGLISLKDRPLSPVARLFAQSVAPVVRDIQPKRPSRAK